MLSKDQLSAKDWQDLTDDLLRADLGPSATRLIVSRLQKIVAAKGAASLTDATELLIGSICEQMADDQTRGLQLSSTPPSVILVVGVNGSGKTTTVAKLANTLMASGGHVVLGAADTFRAAAVDQLNTLAQRLGATFVSGPDRSDPASVAFDALKCGQEMGADFVLIDTAGRLHTSATLMDELAKIRRVVQKVHVVDECLLVLDATTGQNGINQARAFVDAVGATGIVLTKLDGSARGGVVVAVEQALELPVKFIGTGEGLEDLSPFQRQEFVEALVTHS